MITRGITDSIHIASLRGEPALEIHPNGWNQLNSLAWTADGGDLFVSANNGITKRSALLRVDRQGKASLLWEHGDSLQIVPSPDGHLLALYEVSHVANVWTIDNL